MLIDLQVCYGLVIETAKCFVSVSEASSVPFSAGMELAIQTRGIFRLTYRHAPAALLLTITGIPGNAPPQGRQ